MKQPIVNQDTCIACGTCPALAPASFTIDPNSGKAVATIPAGNTEDEINTAISSCPTGSISWQEE